MKNSWELQIFHELPPTVEQLGSLAVGDLDSDGHVEVIVGGEGALLWYRPHAHELGTIAEGHFHVGLALEDLDGDGKLEVIAGRSNPSSRDWTIVWFKAGADLQEPWSYHEIDPQCNGGAHDLVFVDLDGDGERELLANAAYCAIPGIFAYKRTGSPSQPWRKYELSTGTFLEGLAAADLNGDGKIELVHGPDWFLTPNAGPYSGRWKRQTYAPAYREWNAPYNWDARLIQYTSSDHGAYWQREVICQGAGTHQAVAYDLDGDGQLEIVCGEHNPFWPYRNRCRLLVYKKANPEGTAWYRYTLDDRFEHHDGTKIFEIFPSRLGIISHGWKDSIYVHLWEAY